MTDYVTKDSGVREEFDSGMVRDTQAGKARFDLLLPERVPYDRQMLTRAAALMERGQSKYGERNWEKANSATELGRAQSSALRHLMQYLSGESDEDHAAAVIFNLIAAETIAYKLAQNSTPKNEVAPPDIKWERTNSTPTCPTGGCVNCDG